SNDPREAPRAMTADLMARVTGRAGHITLNRPKALNALTHQMCLDIETALDAWRDDDAIALILIDAEGERAFCAGGDIAKMYETGRAGDFSYGRQFWRDEYRLNAKLATYPKPIVTFLQGFTMGGGVGIGCHASHRIVGETSQISMPEVSIGLVPDVGGTLLLARAPGHCGEYLALTAERMDAASAIYAGFADSFLAESAWEQAKTEICASGAVPDFATAPAPSALAEDQGAIDAHFAHSSLTDIHRALSTGRTNFCKNSCARVEKHSPLAMETALRIIRLVRETPAIEHALALEYRSTARAMEHGDFLEGIRAQIIDRDKNTVWRHAMGNAGDAAEAMLAPLPDMIPPLELAP
ncbi:MAG: enoyl-CoA hydratase/isomerase family protein, partial [Pseudomonadota bacterium]